MNYQVAKPQVGNKPFQEQVFECQRALMLNNEAYNEVRLLQR